MIQHIKNAYTSISNFYDAHPITEALSRAVFFAAVTYVFAKIGVVPVVVLAGAVTAWFLLRAADLLNSSNTLNKRTQLKGIARTLVDTDGIGDEDPYERHGRPYSFYEAKRNTEREEALRTLAGLSTADQERVRKYRDLFLEEQRREEEARVTELREKEAAVATGLTVIKQWDDAKAGA